MTKRAIPAAWTQLNEVADPEKDLPPWDRTNPSYAVGAGKDEKSVVSVSVRLTAKESRDLQKIVQHRRYPTIENTTDAVRVGLMMLRYWYAIHHNDPEMKGHLDIEMWENERMARKRFRERVLTILDAMATEMAEARRLGYDSRLEELCVELKKYKAQLTDEELRGKANRLWIEFNQGLKKTGLDDTME